MRKKFTMLFAALLACVGVMAQVAPQISPAEGEGYLYYIRNVRAADYYVTTTKGLNGGAQQLGSANSFNDTKAKVAFKMLDGGKIVSANTTATLYLGYTTTDGAANSVQLFAEDKKEDNGYTWKCELQDRTNYPGYAILPGGSGNSFNMHGGSGANIGLYTKADDGSTWVFEPANKAAENAMAIPEAEALLAGMGDKIGEYSRETADELSAALDAAKADPSEANFDALLAAISNVKVNLPVDGKYYQIHSSLGFAETKAVYSDGTNPRWMTLNNDDKSFYWQAEETADGAIVLKNAKDGKYMVGNANQSWGWTMADEYTDASKLSVLIFSDKENENGYEYGLVMNNWQMHAGGHGGGAGDNGEILSYNTSSANSASSWFIKEVELEVFYDVTYNFVYNGDVKYSQTKSVKENTAYPAVVVPALPYGVVAENVTTPDGTVTGNFEKEFTLTVTKNLPFAAAADVNSINTWYYARMHTNQPGYIGDIADDNSINVAWGKSSDVWNENFVWGFAGNIWDGITVVNKGTGKQLTSTGGGNVTLTDNGTAFFVAQTSETTAHATNGFCLRKKDSNQYVNANYGAGKLSHWGSTDAGSTMFLTEYVEKEVSVSDVNWATMYLDYAAYIPEGVKAYTVTGVEDGYVTLTQLEGVIPANTGVILENEGDFTFKMAAKDVAAAQGNLLQGSVENSYVEGPAYVLANKNDKVGLYKAALNKDAEGNTVTENGTHFLNNANKAYLPAPAGAAAPMFSFNRGEGTTGIEDAELTIDNGQLTIYDITGRRVEKMEKGIYIVNGKKVLVK